MKKLLLLTSLLLALPVFAACPIGSASTCSIANVAGSPGIGMNDEFDTANPAPFSGTSLPDLKEPSKITNFNPGGNTTNTPAASRDYTPRESVQNFRQKESDYSYNSSCQFGVCKQTGTPPIFQN